MLRHSTTTNRTAEGPATLEEEGDGGKRYTLLVSQMLVP